MSSMSYACDRPGCGAIGDHVCLPELLEYMLVDEEFLEGVWAAYLQHMIDISEGEVH